MAEMIRVTLKRSTIGRTEHQKRIVKALGFKKLHQTRTYQATPSVMGMVNQVIHLVEIEPVSGGSAGGEA